MAFYRFSEDEVAEIKQRLEDITLLLKKEQRTEPNQVWYDSQEFLQIMNVSKRTAAYWRESNKITYAQIGQKIYYRLSDILTFLSQHTIQSTSNTQNPEENASN